MRILSRAEVKRLVPMPRAIELVSLAFQDLAAGKAQSPLRTPLSVAAGPGTTLVMPAYVPGIAALGLKVVSVFGQNPARGLPTITSVVCLLDDTTGQPLALMDGGYLTALRTGAVSGVATSLLAREDSHVLTVIGAGAQAMTQVAAVCAVRPIRRVNVVGRSPERLAAFRDRMEEDWPELVPLLNLTVDLQSAVREADVICTATSSSTPVFDDADVRPGTHVNGVGSFTPAMQEGPTAFVQRALVVMDEAGAALEEAGDLIIPLQTGEINLDHYHRELGHVASGTQPARVSEDEVTFFKSVGNAVQDMAVGRCAYDEAIRQRVGIDISL